MLLRSFLDEGVHSVTNSTIVKAFPPPKPVGDPAEYANNLALWNKAVGRIKRRVRERARDEHGMLLKITRGDLIFVATTEEVDAHVLSVVRRFPNAAVAYTNQAEKYKLLSSNARAELARVRAEISSLRILRPYVPAVPRTHATG